MRLEHGQEIDGRYRLVNRIGSGGMADVWAADDSMLGRQVALKFLHERFGADEQFVERFRREAQSAAGLQHPNVVSVYDRGEHEGRNWIAMELVQGASLKDLIERGLSPAEAVEIVRQILAGVSFAHERGIIHRDLKPQNVLVDAEGRARVTDFGIARAGASEITQTGSVLGTAQYLSPEQAQGLETTETSDIYSVGVILYEALTGRLPFNADTAVAIALKQVSEPPIPPKNVNPAIPPALDAVVMRALAKDPKDRFQNASEFLMALDAAEANPEAGGTAIYAVVDPPPEEEDNRKRNILIALAILALLAAAAIAYALTRPDQVLVPSVIGQDRTEATEELEGEGFEVVASDFESCDEPDTVSETDPPAGAEADEGSEVEIFVSLGLQVKIPSEGVAGETAQDAVKTLRDKNLQVTTRQVTSNSRAGEVIGTEPETGEEVECESQVAVLVSKGPKLYTVPDVVGLQESDAVAQISDAGLTADVEEENSDLPAGEVFAQDPPGGTELKRKKDAVVIRVSNGQGTVVVPDVEGQPQSTALNALRSRGATNIDVISQETDDESLDGRVISQAPSPGSRIRATDQVTIYVGDYVEPEVPEEPEEPEEPVDPDAEPVPRGQRTTPPDTHHPR